MQKEIGFFQMLPSLGEWGTPHLVAHPLYQTQTKPSKSRTKGRAQSSCSVLKHRPLEPAGSLLKALCGAGAARAMQLPEGHMLPVKGAHECISECFPSSAGARDRDSLLQAMSHAATKVMWPVERTGQNTI